MFKWKRLHMISFAEETGDHLLRSASTKNNFRWIWLVFEDPHGGFLFWFGLIRIDPWFVRCDDLINVFWSTTIVFFQISLHHSTRTFFERLSNFAGANEKKSFLCSCMLVEEIPKDASFSQYVTWRSCIISSRTASKFSNTRAVLHDLHEPRVWVRVGHNWIY